MSVFDVVLPVQPPSLLRRKYFRFLFISNQIKDGVPMFSKKIMHF